MEEESVAELIHQLADIYIDAYQKNNLKIERDVIDHIVHSQMQVIGGRKSSLMGSAQLASARTNKPGNPSMYTRFGHNANKTMMEVQAKIDLYNLTPRKPEPVTNNITTYHLVNSRVTHGDDNSVNIVNEKELFESLSAAITKAVGDETERTMILARLDELKAQKTKTDYLAMVPKFIAAAASIGHVIGPYLPAIIEKADSLF